MSETNADLARSFWDAYNRRDRAAVGALLHADVEWHTIAGPLFGVDAISGREALLRFAFEQIPEAIEGYRVSIEEASEQPNGRVLVVGHHGGRGVASGATVEMETVGIVRFEAGRITYFQEFPTREEALEAAASSTAARTSRTARE